MSEMAKPPKSKDEGSDQERSVWLADGVGEKWKEMRQRRELNQRELARRIGVSSGTISNVETGRQRTLERGVYARWLRAISQEQPSIPDDMWDQLVKVFLDTDAEEAKKLIAIAPIIKTPRTKP